MEHVVSILKCFNIKENCRKMPPLGWLDCLRFYVLFDNISALEEITSHTD